MKKIEFLEKGSLDNFDKIIIFIHGWKGNKNSFESLSSIIKIPNAKWIFPQAPYKIENTTNEYSWSYQHSDGSYEIDEPISLLSSFLKNNILNNIDSKKVFFIGFSQGATVCYDMVLQLEYQWGGVFPVAGFNRDQSKPFSIHSNQFQTPIFIGHGVNDEVVPIDCSNRIYKDLKLKNCNVFFNEFNGGHKISINYLRKIEELING